MFTTAIKKTVLSYIKNVTALWTALHYKPAYSFLYCPPYSAGSTQLKEIALFELFCLTGDNLRHSSVWNREVSLTPYDVKLSECCRRAGVPGENLSGAVVSRNAL